MLTDLAERLTFLLVAVLTVTAVGTDSNATEGPANRSAQSLSITFDGDGTPRLHTSVS